MKQSKIWIFLICFFLILSGTVVYASNFKKSYISLIQKELKILGYYHGNINGILNKTTEESVKSFQKDYHLKVDGIPGRHTRRALEQAIKQLKNKRKKYVHKTKTTKSHHHKIKEN